LSIGYLPRADLSLIISVWDGVVTAEAWRHNLERVLADPAFPSTRVHLVDLRSADIEGTITEQDIKDVVEFLASHAAEIAGRKAAILVGEEFPKSSIFERLIQPYGLTAAAFTFLDTACTWLGVDPGEAQQSLRTLGVRLRGED
jgi:hypothetical protein